MDEALRQKLILPGMDPTERFNLAVSATLQGHPYERVLTDVLTPLRHDRYLHEKVNSLFTHDYTGVTGLHSVETGVDIGARCVEERLEGYLIREGARAGMLHDIGKRGVPAALIMKGTLTPEELAVVRLHPALSGRYLDFTYSSIAWDAAHGHHEGTATSYPPKLI